MGSGAPVGGRRSRRRRGRDAGHARLHGDRRRPRRRGAPRQSLDVHHGPVRRARRASAGRRGPSRAARRGDHRAAPNPQRGTAGVHQHLAVGGHGRSARGARVLHRDGHRRPPRHRLRGPLQLRPHRHPAHRSQTAVGAKRRRGGGPAPVQHPRHRVLGRRARLHRRHPDPARPGRAQPRRVRVPGDRGDRAAVEARAAQARRHDPVRPGAQRGDRISQGDRPGTARRPRRGAVGRRRRRQRHPRDDHHRRRHHRGDLPPVRRRQHPRRIRRHATRSRAAGAGPRAERADRGREAARARRSHAGHPLPAGQGRSGRVVAEADARVARRMRESAAGRGGTRGSQPDSAPAAVVGRPVDARGHRALHARRAVRRALVPVEHRVHPPHERTGLRRRRVPHRLRRQLPRARPGRRVSRCAGGCSARPAAPPRHHQVQPGPDLDPGERRRHRRRLPVHLRDGRARRLPVRRPHHPGVEPPSPAADTRFRSRTPVAAALLRPDPVVPGERGGVAGHARRRGRRPRRQHEDRRRGLLAGRASAIPRRQRRGIAARRAAMEAARAEERRRWSARGEFAADSATTAAVADHGLGIDSEERVA